MQEQTTGESTSSSSNLLETVLQSEGDGEYTMYALRTKSSKPIVLEVSLNDDMTMELDMGVSWSIISEDIYNKLWNEYQPTLNLSSSI